MNMVIMLLTIIAEGLGLSSKKCLKSAQFFLLQKYFNILNECKTKGKYILTKEIM